MPCMPGEICSGRPKPISVEVYTNLMSNRFRVAIMLATALMLGAEAYGHAFDISPPGALQDIWDHSGWVTYGLAVLGVFLIYRWWALLPAIAPVAVIVYLHNMTDYVPPWREEPPPSLRVLPSGAGRTRSIGPDCRRLLIWRLLIGPIVRRLLSPVGLLESLV